MSEIERLRQELKQQKEANETIKRDLEESRLRQQIEEEKLKQIEWQQAKEHLATREASIKAHHEQAMKEMAALATDPAPTENPSLQYLKDKIAELQGAPKPSEDKKPEEPTPVPSKEVADQLKALLNRQQELEKTAREAVKGHEHNPMIQDLLQKLSTHRETPAPPQDEQSKLMDHLIQTIQGQHKDPKVEQQKDILRQFLVDSNKITTTGGATTLKPDLLKKLTGESDIFNMGEWLAKLNRHSLEESKCDTCSEECKLHKKSGMLDKATTNIQHKETWPQKNLLEDWADEDMDFKNMLFEHLVAGEMRTIETSTNPAEILGRLRLVRRMAYAKLRGYEWQYIRKMYAAILRSIEARDNTWESNFDRYESILYRRPPGQPRDKERNQGSSNPSNNKKWFCRDWNKGNCTKSAPHKSWFGTGTNATQRTVLHMCATCYMKDKAQRDHPESHESCPYKEA